MLKRIHVQGFKSLLDVEIELAPLVVLFGPNAAGKSNLLEALLLLSRLVTEPTLGKAFEPPLRGYPLEAFSIPGEGLPALLAQESAELRLEADIQPSSRSDRKTRESLRYAVGVQVQLATGSLEVADEYLTRLKRDGAPKGSPRIERQGDKLLVRHLGRAGRPFEEPVGLGHTLASNRQLAGEKRYPDFDHLRQELSAWRIYYLDPRGAMRAPQPPREVSDIGQTGESLAPFLYRLKGNPRHARHFQAIGRALRSAIPTLDRLDVDLDPRRGTLDIVIEQDGTTYSSRVVSEGTLRVLALCAIAANPWPAGLVAFEEPENGVHPRRLEVIADLLLAMASNSGSQVIVTTHSPTLIAAMARRSRAEQGNIALLRCSQEGRETKIRPFEPFGPLFEDEEIRRSLTGQEDEGLIEGALLRGWLDG